ncbi:MAG TPA: cytochrome c, partial [Chloroflexota bacterium]
VSTERVAMVPLTPAPQVTGDPNRGRQLFVDARIVTPAGCASCHTIRGVPGATGIVGPNLTNITLRPTLAGDTIPNNSTNLVRWIMDPPSLKQNALMPNLGVSQQDAQDLAAFLASQPYNPPSR